MIRKPTAHEIAEVFPLASRGWESQHEEVEEWLDASRITGALPTELQGTFIRNGPGQIDVFGTPLAHPIDGDGMVVALTFVGGKVHFRNKFTDTFSHKGEAKAGKMLFNGNMGSRVPGGKPKSRAMRDPAHTNAFYWGAAGPGSGAGAGAGAAAAAAGKILACHEYALPHALDPATLETLGPDNLGGKLDGIKALSAHYRYDAVEDLLAVIGFRAGVMGKKPKMVVLEFDDQWRAVREATLHIDGLNYAHDFLMTPDWYVFHMTPFVDVSAEATQRVLSGELFPGEALGYVPGLPSRMVLVQRRKPASGRDEDRCVLQFDTAPCHIYHFCNAVQHGGVDSVREGRITFGATCMPPGFSMEWQHRVFLSNTGDAPGLFHNFEIDIAKGTCQRTLSPKVAARSNEFPFAHPYRHSVQSQLLPQQPQSQSQSQPQPQPSTSGAAGARQVLAPRFVYLMAADENVPMPFTSIVKYDEQGDEDAVWRSEGVVGEPVFVPRLGKASAFFGDDDDGWLITQLYIPGKHEVQFVVLDAKRIADGPVCRIRPNIHVPYSFHGTFTPNVFVQPPSTL